MSDTPKTDAAEFHIDTSGPYVWAHFARQLERDLSQAKDEIARLRAPSGYMYMGYWYDYPKAE
jgi:hypothetical protein